MIERKVWKGEFKIEQIHKNKTDTVFHATFDAIVKWLWNRGKA